LLSRIGIVVSAGYLMDRIPDAYKLYASVLIFTVATCVGIAGLVIHGTIPEPPDAQIAEQHPPHYRGCL
jgi:hypothetical protein